MLWEQEMLMLSCHGLPPGRWATLNSGVSCSRHICSVLWMNALTKKYPNLLIICKALYIPCIPNLGFEAIPPSLKFCSSPFRYFFFTFREYKECFSLHFKYEEANVWSEEIKIHWFFFRTYTYILSKHAYVLTRSKLYENTALAYLIHQHSTCISVRHRVHTQ